MLAKKSIRLRKEIFTVPITMFDDYSKFIKKEVPTLIDTLIKNCKKILSDSKVSSFLQEVTVDQRISFLNEWNRKRDHREKIYISYDSTNKACQAGDISLIELGHAKDARTGIEKALRVKK